MKTSNSKTKAKAFSGAAFVLLITLIFTACPNPAKPEPQKSKHDITFSVDGANGTLKAKADGIAETDTSPVSVKKGKIVTFTAKADKGYRVKKWMLNGDPITEAGKNTEYKLTVSNAVTVSVSFEPIPPGEAQIYLGLTRKIRVKAVTFDGSDVQVSNCDEGTLANNTETELNANSSTITLKGKITELYCSGNELTQLDVRDLAALQKLDCSKNQLKFLYVRDLAALQTLDCSKNKLNYLYVKDYVEGLSALQTLDCSINQLTELNVQGCSALKKLNCIGNKLNAQAMTKLLNALPNREASDGAKAVLYTEKTEENCKDFTQPAELKTAFDGAKSRLWKLQKEKPDGTVVDI